MAARTASDRRAALARGAEAEAFVASRLLELGWTVLARNWRGGGGEIDIVVRRGDALRIVEVKARARSRDPLLGLTSAKMSRLRAAAEAFLSEHDEPCEDLAFLVAAVWPSGAGWGVEFIDDAFDG